MTGDASDAGIAADGAGARRGEDGSVGRLSKYDRGTLLAAVEKGEAFEYVLFWRHVADEQGGAPGAECLSQWYEAPFELEGRRFATAEHAMMYGKARLFGDHGMAARILAAAGPGEARKLGRTVRGFVESRWSEARMEIVTAANVLKFGQNAELKRYLLGTGDCILVEASPLDRIWGIGLDPWNPLATAPTHWQGTNLLGFALMTARDRLRAGERSGA